jgi:hypothetical protein
MEGKSPMKRWLILCVLLCGVGVALYFTIQAWTSSTNAGALVDKDGSRPPVKMEADGALMPVVRRQVCPPQEGQVKRFRIEPNDAIPEEFQLADLYDPELAANLADARAKIRGAALQKAAAANNALIAGVAKDKARFKNEADQQDVTLKAEKLKLQALIEANNADPSEDRAGFFYLKSPRFTQEEAARVGVKKWTVLNANFREEWKDRMGRPGTPILNLGAKDGPWEIELKIPQKHIGQVLGAFKELKKDPNDPKNDFLEVDYLVKTDANRTFKGRLYRNRIDKADARDEFVLAYVQIFREDDADVPENYRLPNRFLTSGVEVHAEVR